MEGCEMKQKATLDILMNHRVGVRDFMVFGHFLEHFHRQVYGGVYDPRSPFADDHGFRTDVIEALRQIKVPVIRWPGGCFVSAYPWKKGVGQNRKPYYDKAWRVEEPNTFGTDEFVAFCREVGAEPYICTNAGTGTPEEMADWVEYCNLNIGEWASLRQANGHIDPHNVKYWSIGNENWGPWEMGAKTADEWARYALEAAKMMKRVDPDIKLSVASIPDLDWNVRVLKSAGGLLDWISIHGYWSFASEAGEFENDYDAIIAHALEPERAIEKTEHILGAVGFLDKVRIAFDEWNLRGWCHPGFGGYGHVDHKLLDRNDINSHYTMADAIFTACFLNACLRHPDTVGMANFSPAVNTVGAIFTHKDGIVLRPTYHVFDLFTNHTFGEIVHSVLVSPSFDATSNDGKVKSVRHLDTVVTRDPTTNQLGIVLVNLHKEDTVTCQIRSFGGGGSEMIRIQTLVGDSVNAFNDIDHPAAVSIQEKRLSNVKWACFEIECPPHSVSVLNSES